jgi:hypothetical protein
MYSLKCGCYFWIFWVKISVITLFNEFMFPWWLYSFVYLKFKNLLLFVFQWELRSPPNFAFLLLKQTHWMSRVDWISMCLQEMNLADFFGNVGEQEWFAFLKIFYLENFLYFYKFSFIFQLTFNFFSLHI